MRRLTFLLRPSWAILAVVVVAFAYLCFTVLAPWQLGKNTSTSHRNNLIAASVNADPVPATNLLNTGEGTPPAGTNPADTEWRRVIASGSYVPNSMVVERLQHLNDQPAYGVLAAFRLDDGRVVLVDRGLIAAVNGSDLPVIAEPPSGPQRIEGRVRKSQGAIPGKDPMVRDGLRQVYSVDTAQLSTVLDTPLTGFATGELGGYLQLDAGQPGAFTPESLPQLDAGPYLSYGLQWIAFGVMAPLGLGYFVYAEIRERRRDRAAAEAATATPDEQVPAMSTAGSPAAEAADDTNTAPASVSSDTAPKAQPETAPAPDEPPAKPRTTADRLADRYGNSRR
ncbi:SURF1 family cytochrome oxidase biogenesis protein [Nocardia africana]|uniref:SURF1 family cytochrome oxidase biogenesis protein n=1 Tax=Nocardia africana TaxID=134964 RepID=UPI0007C821E5|nr:SURF1 family cytochrome oxidase biogenesis protein [Nocardia africana]MCC3314857.1 SURF1 family protein [Nocardia africana]